MNHTFRITPGTRRFCVFLLAPLFAAVAVFINYKVVASGQKDAVVLVPGVLGVVLFLAMAAFVVLDVMKWQLIIDDNAITRISIWGTRVLLLEDIKGYRRPPKKYIVIEPLPGRGKTIDISGYAEHKQTLEMLLNERITDLDAQEWLEDEAALMEETSLGATAEERKINIARGKRLARIANITGFVLAFAMLLMPAPYFEYMFCVNLLSPLVALLLFRKYNGVIRLNVNRNSKRTTLMGLMFAPAVVLTMKGAAYHIDSYQPILMPLLITSGAYIGVMLLGIRETTELQSSKAGSLFVLLLCGAGYGFGAVTTANCYFDKSAAITYKATVLDKRKSKGKSTSYYLRLTAWGSHAESSESVGSEEYDSRQVGDTVTISYYQGLMHAHWYIID